MPTETSTNHTDRIIREAELIYLVGLSRSTIYRSEKAGLFPKRRKLSRHSVGWVLSEIQSWMKNPSAYEQK